MFRNVDKNEASEDARFKSQALQTHYFLFKAATLRVRERGMRCGIRVETVAKKKEEF